jgi:hypothetical protein
MTGRNGESEKRREKDVGKDKLIDERERPRLIVVVLIQTPRISSTTTPCDLSAIAKANLLIYSLA